MKEIWKEYKVYQRNQYNATWLRTDLEISNFGNVRGKLYKYKPFTEDMISYSKDGRRMICGICIYILVDKLFRGPLPKGYCVHHIDENKLNDRLDNLQRLKKEEHWELHHKGRKSYFNGKKHTDEAKQKMSNAHKGKRLKQKTKQLMTKQRIGRHWYNNGTNEKFCYDCPDGYIKGRLSVLK